MTLSQNIRHRRAAGILRRDPQSGFSPTAIFNFPTPSSLFPTSIGRPGRGDGDGGDDGDDGDDDAVTVTVIVPPSSTAPSTTAAATSASSPTTSSIPTTTTPTTTSTPTTSSTPTPVTPTTSATPTTTALPTTTHTTSSKALTPLSISSASSTASGVAASANANSNNNDSSISTGAIVGGIAAGIVAIAAIGFAITFFLRRARKRNDSAGFDEGNFRRSAMVLDDPPTVEDTYNPPNMVQRPMMGSSASPAPTFGTMYGRPGPDASYGNQYEQQNYAGYGSNYQSFTPGQVVHPYGPGVDAYPASPLSPQTARPMYPQSPYTQSPFSPVSPNEQYTFHDNAPAAAGGAVNGAGYPVLTRKGSNQSQESGGHQQPEMANPHRESVPANDYVDLNRSSVSPYQAAQYVEISRRLNTQPPEGLRTADLDRELPPPLPGKGDSPFADPNSAPPSPGGGQYAIDRRHLDEPSGHERTFSGDSNMQEPQALEFPAPPSPVHPPSSRYRIDSMPPSLPEINIEASRVSVSSYPMLASPSVRDSHAPSMLTAGLTPGGPNGSAASRFPTTPSPLASSFGMPSPPPAAATAAFVSPGPPPALNAVASAQAPAQAEAAPAPTARQPSEHALDQKKRATSYSMYDAEDAYGGI